MLNVPSREYEKGRVALQRSYKLLCALDAEVDAIPLDS